MKTLMLFVIFAFTACLALAVGDASTGNRDLDGAIAGIPLQYQIYITWAVVGFKLLAELYSSVRAGGGLRRILVSFWLGEQAPKSVVDAAQKMTRPPFEGGTSP